MTLKNPGLLLRGLLPEFKDVLPVLRATANLTFKEASATILDQDLTEYAKGGARANDRVFLADDSSTIQSAPHEA